LSILALGVFAAILSTADTNLNVVSIAISKLIKHRDWARFENETPNKIEGTRTGVESKLLNVTRFITIIIGILSVGLAKLIPDIVDLIVAGASAIGVFIPAVLVTLFKGTCKTSAAIASIVCGFVVLVGLLPFAPKAAFIPATLISVIVYFMVAPFVRNRAQKLVSPGINDNKIGAH